MCGMYLREIKDINEINKVLTASSIHDDICDDLTFGQELKILPPHFKWLAIYVDNEIQGVFALTPQNSITAEIHTSLLPSLRGKQAILAGKLLLEYLFNHYQKAVSWVPLINKKALFYSKLLQFEIEGLNKKSYLKNGELVDQYLVGLTKEDYLCQQYQQ